MANCSTRVCSPQYVCYTVLEKKTEQVKNDQVKGLSDQMKITRPPSPPASGQLYTPSYTSSPFYLFTGSNLTAMDCASGLSITSSLSSSSISSASTSAAAAVCCYYFNVATMITIVQGGSNVEALPISDWLTKYKLVDYISLFQQAGFDNTDFIAGITTEVGTVCVCECVVSVAGHCVGVD